MFQSLLVFLFILYLFIFYFFHTCCMINKNQLFVCIESPALSTTCNRTLIFNLYGSVVPWEHYDYLKPETPKMLRKRCMNIELSN